MPDQRRRVRERGGQRDVVRPVEVRRDPAEPTQPGDRAGQPVQPSRRQCRSRPRVRLSRRLGVPAGAELRGRCGRSSSRASPSRGGSRPGRSPAPGASTCSTSWPSSSSSRAVFRVSSTTSGEADAADAGGVHGDPEPLVPGAGDVADRRELERAVDVLGLAQERRGVAHRPGQHAVGDDADRHLPAHPVLGEPVAGRLEADQPVDRGRDPDRAAAVVAVGEGYGAGRDQRRRTRRGGAGGAGGVPRASGPARAAGARRTG